MIGTRLSHFRILAKLGEGGMGVVYRAEDERLRRQVALKLLPPELVASEERRLRFLREARAAAAISHPSIAAIHEVDEAEGVVFIAMELVEGKTLREIIGGRPMPIKDALRIATEMAEGLAQAHQARVVHRDLKPDNVMVRPDQHIKILDFGLAKLLEEHADVGSSELSKLETISGEVTRAGKVLGTPAYMSPEQVRGQPLDARSDIFAFGSVLYEMVTGRPPFLGKTSADTLGAIIKDEPVAPSQLNPEVPPKLEEIIGKCMEKEPRDRYQHADELVVDLRRLRKATDSGVQAVQTPGGRVRALPAGVWARLTATRAGLAALLAGLVALLMAGSVATWRLMRAEGRFQQGDLVLVADFEDATGRGDLGPAIQDALEHMLAQSSLVDVIRGQRRREFLTSLEVEGAAKIDRDNAHRLCARGGSAGFAVGQIGREGEGYSLRAEMYRAGRQSPLIAISSGPHPEEDLLMAVHAAVLEIREALGEAPRTVSATEPPMTRSLRAYQAFSLAADSQLPLDEMQTLYRKALEIDPAFVRARQLLGDVLWDLGEFERWRQTVEEVYRRSATLPEKMRLRAEIDFLDATYEFDTEVQRLKAVARLYPHEAWPQTWLCNLYPYGYEDLPLAEHSCREAYRLLPSPSNLFNLCDKLWMQGKGPEIEQAAADFRARKGAGPFADLVLLRAYTIRGEEEKIRATFERFRSPGGLVRPGVPPDFLEWLLATGRLGEAEGVASLVWRTAEDEGYSNYKYVADLRQAWLGKRRSEKGARIRAESIATVQNELRQLPKFAALAVDMRLADELDHVIRSHEVAQQGSKSRFVREELEFARGCLALIRGEAQEARGILEPLARSSTLSRRRQVLGRAYEALGLLKEAAVEYERALENPHLKWATDIFAIPATVVLEQLRLAQVYEGLGNKGRARHWYERFLADWKDADPDLPELIEARKRLAALTQHRTGAQ